MATRDFSTTQAQEYIRGGGQHCPYCNSEEIEGGPFQCEAGVCWQEVTCLQCEERWHDIYQLADIHALSAEGDAFDLHSSVEHPRPGPRPLAKAARRSRSGKRAKDIA
jgi:hypothetical protein